MYRTILLVAAFILTIVLIPFFDVSASPPTAETRLIVEIEDDVSINEIDTDFDSVTLSPLIPSQNLYVGTIADRARLNQVRSQLIKDRRITNVETDSALSVPVANPSNYWSWGGSSSTPFEGQSAADLINLNSAEFKNVGAGIVVAVLDTGIQSDHPYFNGKITTGYDFVDDDNDPTDQQTGVDSNGNNFPDEAFGHGTHVAGIVHLIAPEAEIMPIRILDSDGNGNLTHLIAGINYAIEQGANIINLSLSSEIFSQSLRQTISSASDEGVIFVAAAGNVNSSTRQYPAAFGKVFSVSAIDENRVKTSSSSYGPWVDIAAPGDNIFSAFPQDAYAWWSGTSMATPFVSGQVALLLADHVEPQTVFSIIQRSATDISSENSDLNHGLGAGLINLEASYCLTWDCDIDTD